MGLVLYPYVYLLARVAFSRQSARVMDAARALGCTPRQAFFRAALPVAWPAIAAGAAFVPMETLADYGTVLHLGVQTLSTGIFRTWFARGAPVAAAQLAALLLGLAAVVFWIERLVRGGRRFADDPGGRSGEMRRMPLRGWSAALATGFCMLPVALGFALPAAELARLMPEKAPPDTSRLLLCPMPGQVVRIWVAAGDEVQEGQALATVEAMKMENILRAERKGKVATNNTKPEAKRS